MLHTVPNGGHRRRHQRSPIAGVVVPLDPEAQLVGQSPSQSAAEEKGDGAHQELAHEQQHNQHEVLCGTGGDMPSSCGLHRKKVIRIGWNNPLGIQSHIPNEYQSFWSRRYFCDTTNIRQSFLFKNINKKKYCVWISWTIACRKNYSYDMKPIFVQMY